MDEKSEGTAPSTSGTDASALAAYRKAQQEEEAWLERMQKAAKAAKDKDDG